MIYLSVTSNWLDKHLGSGCYINECIGLVKIKIPFIPLQLIGKDFPGFGFEML